eukprot:3605776-Rhodomonas_salina.2
MKPTNEDALTCQWATARMPYISPARGGEFDIVQQPVPVDTKSARGAAVKITGEWEGHFPSLVGVPGQLVARSGSGWAVSFKGVEGTHHSSLEVLLHPQHPLSLGNVLQHGGRNAATGASASERPRRAPGAGHRGGRGGRYGHASVLSEGQTISSGNISSVLPAATFCFPASIPICMMHVWEPPCLLSIRTPLAPPAAESSLRLRFSSSAYSSSQARSNQRFNLRLLRFYIITVIELLYSTWSGSLAEYGLRAKGKSEEKGRSGTRELGEMSQY